MKFRYKNYISLAFLAVLAAVYVYFTTNNASPIRNSIIREINSCQSSEDFCLINIRDITAFEWDTMFFFQDNIDLGALGISNLTSDVDSRFHKCFREFSNVLFFLRNEEIVHCEYEDLKWNGVDPSAKFNFDGAFHGVGPLTVFEASKRNNRYYLKVYEQNQ